MRSSRSSNNYRILRTILSKIRQITVTPDMSYLVVYAFLYKYCSDQLKDHFLSVIQEKAITLDEAYRSGPYQDIFREDAFHMFGYHINASDCFFDEVIHDNYSENFFLFEFFTSFSRALEFPEKSNYEKYFKFIFRTVEEVINFKKYEVEGENHLIVKDLIYAISKLDIFENEFPYSQVFERICQSKLLRIDTDPDYINSLLNILINVNKNHVEDIYNPFLNDASSLINLHHSYEFGLNNTYAKSPDRLAYCSNIVKFMISNYDLDHVFLEYGSPFESTDINGAEFDVITARIPAIKNRNLQRLTKVQRREKAKNNKRKELEDLLSVKFNMDEESFEKDSELKYTIENLLEKMDFESEMEVQFRGEYESLKDNEYLFIINLIDSLKDDGIMIVSMSQSFLSKNTLEILRKYLVFEKNYIDTIISIPNELSRPQSSEIVVIFRKNKNIGDILFIDMSTDYSLKRERYNVPGLFRKNLTFDEDSLLKVADVFGNRKVVDKYSNVVPISEIASNEFNLSISRYVDTFEGEFIRLEDLKNEKEEITSKIKVLNKKIDMMMDELNIKF